MFRCCVQLLAVFAVLGLCTTLLAQEGTKDQPAAKSGGTLRIKDATYKLTHAVAFEAKFYDEKVLNILLSATPIDVNKLKASLEKDGTDEGYFTFEPQVKVRFDKKGKASFSIAYADSSSSNISGERLSGQATLKDGVISGQAKLVLDPEDEGRFKTTFEIQFSEKLLAAKIPEGKPADDQPETDEPERPKTAKAKSPQAKKTKSDDDDVPETVEEAEALAKKLLAEALGEDEDAPKSKKSKAGEKAAATLNVKDLPLPDDASDVAYKKIVQQVTFQNPADVKATAEAFAAGLEDQGWKESGADLITAKSAILKRTRGKAELTIFVKPDGDGSIVTMMTRGLSWDDE